MAGSQTWFTVTVTIGSEKYEETVRAKTKGRAVMAAVRRVVAGEGDDDLKSVSVKPYKAPKPAK